MGFYDDARASAEASLAEAGASAILRRFVASGDDLDPTVTPADHPCVVVTTGYRLSEVDGTRVLATDRKALISTAGLDITPTTSDRLVIEGVEFRLIDVQPLRPATTTLLFKAQVRR